jgi:hypothetical protein
MGMSCRAKAETEYGGSCVGWDGKLASLTDLGFRMLHGATIGNKLVISSMLDQGHKLRWYFWVTNGNTRYRGRDDTEQIEVAAKTIPFARVVGCVYF